MKSYERRKIEMFVFNLITKIIFFSCLGWSVGMLVFFFIKRAIVRKKAKKEILENEIGEDESRKD